MKNLAFFAFVILVFSCSTTKKTTIPEETVSANTEPQRNFEEEGYFKATIKDFSSLDGCGFLIITNEVESKELMPFNLSKDYEKDGKTVWLKYRPIKPKQNICMKGIPITIEAIEPR